tara:strand:+ start:242 stop:1009 length:768 start_codon:yes stop_codon:yes gene_type:complete
MCTSVVLFRKDHPWPIIIGSNRDESFSRNSKFPGRHWLTDYPKIVGGYDVEKKGTWIAVNDFGLYAIIHNRKLKENNNLKKETRGKIILKILSYDNLNSVLSSIKSIDQKFYNGFNLIVGDKSNCFWVKHNSVNEKINYYELNEGLSILTDKDLNDLNDKKINFYLNKFSHAPIPNPNNNYWLSWELLLSTEIIDNQQLPMEAICFNDLNNNFGTRSSSLIAISNSFSIKQFKNPIIFRSTEYAPNKSNYVDVNI